MKRMRLDINGIVQGVGFRPFIYNLAQRFSLTGWVKNVASGVVVEIEGGDSAVAAFVSALQTEVPPLAVVEKFVAVESLPKGDTAFQIKQSDIADERQVFISPDIATCADCQRELTNPSDRRFRYPFTNCTNCGPRYTIIRDVPYDRERTTMAEFGMCSSCRTEYLDPTNRRFHAQPNACPVCGPSYRLIDCHGQLLASNPLETTRRLISEGAIVAVKGIGGYHLACNAFDNQAVVELRRRKIREDKPFAVMGGSCSAISRHCLVSAAEEKVLTGTIRPIVLLSKAPGYALAEAVAPDNLYLGVMLPYAPVHFLLLGSDDVWVMTSGNTSDEPIAYSDEDAVARLSLIADYFLVHNREIYCWADDSVVRVFNEKQFFLRRGRGVAPTPLHLELQGPAVLACGGELKNTFCLTRDNMAFISAHTGNLENAATFNAYQMMIEHYRRILDITPEVAACDLHPGYLSTQYAHDLGLPIIGVQHHHAHIATVLAEHDIVDEAVIGVAFDGTGYGIDGNIWGGEFLLADCCDFTRLGHASYIKLPGGAKAIKEPWRQAAWFLYSLYGRDFINKNIPLNLYLPFGWELALEAAEKGINAPLSSGIGRLFDIAAALLGICCTHINYEGQAAVELEMLSAKAVGALLPYEITDGGMLQLDFRPTFAAMVEAMEIGVRRASLAAAFHVTLATATVDMVYRLSKLTGVKKVALSGGVFQNMSLLCRVVGALTKDFDVFFSSRVPPNDGGLALGQAVVAMKRSG
ncbi:MAG: hypF [Firmicutes bacterium]|nr:hypF [Bacillota bacterium]